jgi:hypothetical protein
MNASEIVVHVMQRNRISVVLDFFRKSVCQSGEPTHAHPHREVLTLDVARRDVLRVRLARTAECLRSLDLRWAVPAGRMGNFAIELDQLGIIDIGAKPGLNRFEIGAMPVASDLGAIRQPLREITNELYRCRAAPIPNAPGRHKFRIGADRNPCPNVASRLRRLFWRTGRRVASHRRNSKSRRVEDGGTATEMFGPGTSNMPRRHRPAACRRYLSTHRQAGLPREGYCPQQEREGFGRALRQATCSYVTI